MADAKWNIFICFCNAVVLPSSLCFLLCFKVYEIFSGSEGRRVCSTVTTKIWEDRKCLSEWKSLPRFFSARVCFEFRLFDWESFIAIHDTDNGYNISSNRSTAFYWIELWEKNAEQNWRHGAPLPCHSTGHFSPNANYVHSGPFAHLFAPAIPNSFFHFHAKSSSQNESILGKKDNIHNTV